MLYHAHTYLTLPEVEEAHQEAMERSGKTATPLLFPDRLESALARPRNVALYGGADLATQAATLIIAISEAQAFENGNKRTADLAGAVFLKLNGYRFAGDPVLLAVCIAECSSPSTRKDAIEYLADWMRPQIEAFP